MLGDMTLTPLRRAPIQQPEKFVSHRGVQFGAGEFSICDVETSAALIRASRVVVIRQYLLRRSVRVLQRLVIQAHQRNAANLRESSE